MKITKINEKQMEAIVVDVIKTYDHEIASYGEVPYRGYAESFAKNYVNRLYAILGAVDESDSKGGQK